MEHLAFALTALVLAGCQTTDTAAFCASAAKAHAAFLVVAASGEVKQKIIDKEALAWAATQAICMEPG